MGIFDGILILSDLDGTLLEHGVLHEEQLAAVEYFTQNGGLFCPATGRAEAFIKENYPRLPLNSYCVVRNGTTIYDPKSNSLVWGKVLDPSVRQRVAEICRRYDNVIRVAYHFAEEMLVISREDVDFFERILGEKRPIYKAVIHFEPNGAARPAEDYKDYTDFQYVRSTHFLFEIISCGTGKGVCVGLIRDMVPKGTLIVGIGDYENDVSLLQASDLPVAVSGGWEPLREYARWVAPPITEHPIRWLVERLEEERTAGRIL